MDTRRPPPQTGAPRFAAMNRVYNRDLRPLVIMTASLSALWTLLSAISNFQDMSLDKNNNYPKLATFSIVLGIMYTVVTCIEVFGITAAVSRRLALVRIYALASVLSALAVISASLLGTVLHFVFKNDLLAECTTLSTGEDVDFSFGWFGPSVHETLTPDDAKSFCQNGWDHDSWADIVSLLIEILFGVLFSYIAFAYYKQVQDPSSATNAFRAPSSQLRGNAYPQHYNPPYNASVPNLGYGTGPSAYAPPPGPPPHFASADDLSKPPGYEGGAGYDSHYGVDKDIDLKDDSKDDPFADFEGASGRAERDVTSRPRPGDHEEFHI